MDKQVPGRCLPCALSLSNCQYKELLGPGGEFEIVRRDASGFNVQTSSSSSAVTDGFDQISIQEKGDEIAYSVNGRSLGAIGNQYTGKGAVGTFTGSSSTRQAHSDRLALALRKNF